MIDLTATMTATMMVIGATGYFFACWYLADLLADRRYRTQIKLRDTLIVMLKQMVVRDQRLPDPENTDPPSAPLPLDPKSIRRRRRDKQEQEQTDAMKEYGSGGCAAG